MLFFGDTREPLSRNRIATDQPRWSWANALAAAEPGSRYRITDVVFSLVREYCEGLGLERGDEVRCAANRGWALELERVDGCRILLERDYAWFVQVKPVEQAGAIGGDAGWTS